MDGNLPLVPESIDSVSQSTTEYFKHHVLYVWLCVAIVVVLEALVIFSHSTQWMFYVVPLAVPLVWYLQIEKSVRHEFMQQFAAANNFQYALSGSLAGLDGSVFQIGHGRSVSDLVTGTYGNAPISFFNYSYTVGYGKGSRTYSFTTFKLQFDTAMPDLLLEGKGRDFGATLFENAWGKKEVIKLEGDFNNYFTLSITKGYEIEALEVFSPDVMATLIDKARAFSLEIVNQHLFVYAPATIGTRAGLYDLYDLVQYFSQTLGPVLARMKPALQAA